MPLDDEAIAQFRSRLLQDDEFRARFAYAPADALREAGIDIPSDVKLPPIDREELDRRVEQLRANVDPAALETLAASPKDANESLRVQADDLLNFARRVRPGDRVFKGVDPSTVYTISAFGTLDW